MVFLTLEVVTRINTDREHSVQCTRDIETQTMDGSSPVAVTLMLGIAPIRQQGTHVPLSILAAADAGARESRREAFDPAVRTPRSFGNASTACAVRAVLTGVWGGCMHASGHVACSV